MLRSTEELVRDSRLARQLVDLLSEVVGDHGESEGTVECLKRILRERNLWRGRAHALAEAITMIAEHPSSRTMDEVVMNKALCILESTE